MDIKVETTYPPRNQWDNGLSTESVIRLSEVPSWVRAAFRLRNNGNRLIKLVATFEDERVTTWEPIHDEHEFGEPLWSTEHHGRVRFCSYPGCAAFERRNEDND